MKNPFRTRYKIETEVLEGNIYYVARKTKWDYFFYPHWWYVGLSGDLERAKQIIELDKSGNWPPKPQITGVIELE